MVNLSKDGDFPPQAPSQEAFGAFPIKHSPAGTTLGVPQELLCWLSHREGSLGIPRQGCEQHLQPIPPTEELSKCKFLVCSMANGRDILGAGLFSCCLSSACLLLLLHFFDLASLPLPSCFSFGGEKWFPFPSVCTSQCQNAGDAWQCGWPSLGL